MTPLMGAAATTKALQRGMISRKLRSLTLPGHCRTLMISIHTNRSIREPEHADATRSPQRPPQQCDMKAVAGPVNELTSGSEPKRQRPLNLVAGLMRYATTSQVFHEKRLSSNVKASNQSTRIPRFHIFTACAGVPAVGRSSSSIAFITASSDAIKSGLRSLRPSLQTPPIKLTSGEHGLLSSEKGRSQSKVEAGICVGR
mmetsp:Transcript_64055/g.144487  ORF Transcript_64055/g.144487 Transcript_64055/m.144487 type:complete len:200 (-) Transcript_64055:231-830(-)